MTVGQWEARVTLLRSSLHIVVMIIEVNLVCAKIVNKPVSLRLLSVYFVAICGRPTRSTSPLTDI